VNPTVTVTERGPETPIDEYVCLALYTASRAITGLYRELLDELELTYPQYLVMRLLWQRGPVPVKDIAATLRLDYGTLSPLLKRLETAGLLRRTRRPEDERSVEIALTDAGRAMRAKADNVPGDSLCAMGLNDRTGAQLRATLEQLTASINNAASAPRRSAATSTASPTPPAH
jgi:DNA-binding MarR family transcriptional regulator